MTINLTPSQQAWLEAQVAAGKLPSIEDGVRAALADFITLGDDDLAWAKPYVDEARISLAHGRVTQGDVILSQLDRHISRLIRR
jgi:antitoxin ParD1/3/4